MNRNKIIRLGIASVAVSVLITSCAPEDSNEGDIALPRDKFIGTWSMTSHHTDPNQAATQYWDLIIEASGTSGEKVALKNFDQTGNNKTITADVNGNNLTIPSTTVNLDGGGQQT